MAIDSLVYNAVSDVKHGVEGGLQSISTQVSNVIGQATATFSSLWDGGFVGISGDTSGLVQEIENHIEKLHGIVDKFNTNASITNALQGQVAEAAITYITAVKDLLNAYSSTYKNLETLLKEQGVEEMNRADTEGVKKIETSDGGTDAIRKQVDTILGSIK